MTVTITELKKEFQDLNAQVERLRESMVKLLENMVKRVEAEEWPKVGDAYYYINGQGAVCETEYSEHYISDPARKARDNVYRTEQAAKEADDQIQFLRRAMTAGDLATDERGYTFGMYNKGPNSEAWATCVGFRKFSTIEARDAFIESEGGIEVFRSRLAKGWPV